MSDQQVILSEIDNETRTRYTNRYRQHGLSHLTLGWGSKEQQEYRFDQVLGCDDFRLKTVLDIGCGFGDLFSYIKSRKIIIDSYTGLDLNPDLVDEAVVRHPDGIFYDKSLMSMEKAPEADVVVMLGLLNFKQEKINNNDYAQVMVQKAFDSTKETLIVDFLSDRCALDYPKEDFVYYYDPSFVLELGLGLSNNVQLIHDYLPIPQKEMILVIRKS
jgi:SAM-dependent methyltransferase